MTNNPYLKNPQEPFIELKAHLEKSVQRCAEFQKLKSAIDSSKDNCSALSKIRQEDPRIQQPEGLFVSLKQQLDRHIENCTAYEKLASTIEKAQLDCQKLEQLAAQNALLKNPTGKFVQLREKFNAYKNNCKRKQIENKLFDYQDKAININSNLKSLNSQLEELNNQYIQGNDTTIEFAKAQEAKQALLENAKEINDDYTKIYNDLENRTDNIGSFEQRME